jgi:hypothetical protein
MLRRDRAVSVPRSVAALPGAVAMTPMQSSVRIAAKSGSIAATSASEPKTARMSRPRRAPDQGLGRGDGLGLESREIQGDEPAAARRPERPALRGEDDLVPRMAEVLEEDVGRGQRGVAAEVDLEDRREPADLDRAARPDDVGRLGQVVLHGDGLQDRVREPGFERADGGRVAAEDVVGERVHLVDRDVHRSSFKTNA